MMLKIVLHFGGDSSVNNLFMSLLNKHTATKIMTHLCEQQEDTR
ncbi:hypothetical protein GMES_2125 [Paraglaciecola mesophila KMM 241]|uniref:Uncharacterized protein n=1 Tax=Paraglaciecola mesophila KMM 241 TaxID=1128912 RepID=K6YKA8_9ALTE|nr:hypothetical protein GMES_2125 [Paraglaciecola mesophila KMM 241]